MKKLFSATAIALALSAGATFAADLPALRAPPPPPLPPPPLWTGFYLGLNAGYSWGSSNNVDVASAHIYDFWGPSGFIPLDPLAASSSLAVSGTANVNRNGFIGGGQAGYNYQFGNRFVVGLEADLQGSGIRGENGFIGGTAWNALTIPGFFSFDRTAAGATTVTARVDWLGTVRGRLGYTFTPALLVYATGGLAYGGVDSTTHQSQFINSTFSFPFGSFGVPYGSLGGVGRYNDTRVGWTVGGGLEWLFTPNLSLKAEYLYYDLGTVRYLNGPLASFGPSLGGIIPALRTVNEGETRVKFDGHIARLGINYHFISAPPVPVIAKY